MARLDDIPQPTRDNVVNLDCSSLPDRPFVPGPPLAQRRVAIVTSAALVPRGHAPFMPGSAEMRTLPSRLSPSDLTMSHVSINYDRTGWQRDVNVAYPVERLQELARDGVIGSVASAHYSVMGATDPKLMVETADQLAGLLKRDRVDAAVFLPV